MQIIPKHAIAFLGIALLFVACSQDQRERGTSPKMMSGNVDIVFSRATGLSLDSILVEVSGSDMQTIRKRTTGNASSIEIGAIPPGPQRTFLVKGYAEGMLAQKGEATVDLESGVDRVIPISMYSLFGSFIMRVPLGLENPIGVAGGRLIYSGTGVKDTLLLEGVLPIREFRSGPLPMGKEYQLNVELWNAQNMLVYQGLDTVWIDADSPEISMELRSLVSVVTLNVTLATRPVLEGLVSLKGTHKRLPRSVGELLILELLPNPKTSGTDWEFTEIINTTTDTLSLEGCRLAKDRLTTGSTTSALLDGCSVSPGHFLVIGRDSVQQRGCSAGGFSLSNSGQSLVLVCPGGLIDSISYSSPTDSLNPFPFEEGVSMQISVEKYALRGDGSQWCAGMDSVDIGKGLKILGTPGESADCQ